MLHAEREKIWAHLKPISTSLFVTTFCFVTFRLSGSRGWKHLRETYFRWNVVDPVIEVTSTNTSKSSKNKIMLGHLERRTQESQEKIGNLMQVQLDLMLSCLLGSSAFLVQFDSDNVQNDLIQIPLLPGESLVHECICPPVEKAVLAAQQHQHENSSLNDGDNDETWLLFAHFVENCQARSRFVEHRRQLGLANPELVPYPGLQGRIAK